MDVKLISGNITQVEADALIAYQFEGANAPEGAAAAIDGALGGLISQLLGEKEFTGKFLELTELHTLGKIRAKRVALVGLGKKPDFTLDRARMAAGEGARYIQKLGAKAGAAVIPDSALKREEAVQAVVEGALLGVYAFKRYKKPDPDAKELKELLLVEEDASGFSALEKNVERGRAIAEAVCHARDWVNEPANTMSPAQLAEEARKIAEKGPIQIKVLEKEDIQKMGMGCLLAVNQGSHSPPRFIIMDYRGAGPDKAVAGFIGKGITFDSGGISLKPGEGMGEMKGDMSGAAAVIASLGAIARLGLKVNITALAPVTENLPGGQAYRPGDIIKSMSGKTVEIISTDAEGRLILSDAINYARQMKFSPLIDLATLTGACHIALGDFTSGAFTNNSEFLQKVLQAAEAAGEKIWQLPMFEEYKEANKSDLADIKNVGGRYGGAITAAWFLREFAEDTPWVHLDIAGTFLSEKDRGYNIKGATGVGVRTLVNLAIALSQPGQ